jgi:ECF transporter S component (folate family)
MGLQPIPLILLSRIVNGFLFGLILHRENAKLWPHAIIAAFATQVICGAGLTTFGLALTTGTPYLALLIMRTPQFLIFIIAQTAVFPVLKKLQEALTKSGLVTALGCRL